MDEVKEPVKENIKFRDIRTNLKHKQIKRLLNLIKKREMIPNEEIEIAHNFITNCSSLTEELNKLNYAEEVKYKTISQWIRNREQIY